jgi:hypothetical protein
MVLVWRLQVFLMFLNLDYGLCLILFSFGVILSLFHIEHMFFYDLRSFNHRSSKCSESCDVVIEVDSIIKASLGHARRDLSSTHLELRHVQDAFVFLVYHKEVLHPNPHSFLDLYELEIIYFLVVLDDTNSCSFEQVVTLRVLEKIVLFYVLKELALSFDNEADMTNRIVIEHLLNGGKRDAAISSFNLILQYP